MPTFCAVLLVTRFLDLTAVTIVLFCFADHWFLCVYFFGTVTHFFFPFSYFVGTRTNKDINMISQKVLVGS